MSKAIHVLLVCANPVGTDGIATAREDRTLRKSIQSSPKRSRFRVETLNAATIDDLRQRSSEKTFDIIHFSGHGTPQGLVFEDEQGEAFFPASEPLGQMLASRGVKVALLNACFSNSVGKHAALSGVDFTIASSVPISDPAAVEFTRGFYDALGRDKSIPECYEEGMLTVRLKNLHIDCFLLQSKETICSVDDSAALQPSITQAQSCVVPRPSLDAKLQESARGCRKSWWRRLFSQSSCPPTVVLFGPSGFGKTSLARALFQSWSTQQRIWLDADQPLEVQPNLAEGGLLVIDRLDSSAPNWLSHQSWLADFQGAVVLVTSQAKIKDSVPKFRPCATGKAVNVIHVDGLSYDEVNSLICNRLRPDRGRLVPAETLKRINREIRGCPLLWQLILDLIDEGDGDVFELFSTKDRDDADDATPMLDAIFKHWFNTLPTLTPTAKRALAAICCVSMIGINIDALKYVVEASDDDLRGNLDPLLCKGLVLRREDGTYLPHGLLRKACYTLRGHLVCGSPDGGDKVQCDDAIACMNDRYHSFLDRQIDRESIAPSLAFTLMDAWLVALREAFNFSGKNYEVFGDKWDTAMAKLDPVFKRAKLQPVHHEWLAQFFAGEVANLGCSSLIGLAIVMRQIRPRNAVLANIVWAVTAPDAHHNDSWALAEIVSAAALHFSEQGEQVADEGMRKIMRLFDRWQRLLSEGADYFSTGDPSPELESSLAGMCVSGAACLLLGERSAMVWANPKICLQFPSVALAAILFAAERQPKERVQNMVDVFWRFIDPSNDSLLAAHYLRTLGIEVPLVGHLFSDEVIELHPLPARLAARLSYADKFMKHVELLQSGPFGSGRLGPIKLRRSEL